ncbi:hypothetical protein Pint_16197 [Pistacia integerrima]|uniref:Uncharacterized protein n=1 Tax=Pistacia integerrima TaxID=434235 RepID=A0ACC0ZDN8_9ROSI|nr:hypothetical protein Pint_16197 [Pistacia integerrima]
MNHRGPIPFYSGEEFKYVTVRQDEKMELAKLFDLVPIPTRTLMQPRDGVSESQFNQVLNIELDPSIEFFQSGFPDNVPPGTVLDNRVCHPKNNDFYLCAHGGMIVPEKHYNHLAWIIMLIEKTSNNCKRVRRNSDLDLV